MRRNLWASTAVVLLVSLVAGCGGSSTTPATTTTTSTSTSTSTSTTTSSVPVAPPVTLASGDWSITLSTPATSSFCGIYTNGPHRININQAAGSGTFSGTANNVTYPWSGTNYNATVTITSGTIDSAGLVNLTYTVNIPTANLPPTAACPTGTVFSSVTITVSNAVAAAAPPATRSRINGGAYSISAQGNTTTGSVTTFTNP